MIDFELDSFKRMDFVGVAATMGYAVDRLESSRLSFVLRNEAGDKVIVKQNEGGHWTYFSVRSPTDSGTIINFIQNRTGDSLGSVRKALRGHAKQPHSLSDRPSVKPSVQDDEGFRKKVAAVWQAADWTPEASYLLSRGLSLSTLNAERFRDTYRQDRNGNVIFPHFDRLGRCGYELRNVGLKTFGANTKRGLWFSKNCCSTLHIVICESSIDCMSHYQLHGGDFGYVSLGGAIGERQRDLLSGLFGKAYLRSARVIVATDNDLAGEQYFSQMQALSDFALERQTPRLKDWNDDLCDR